jgi:hypothetical protein
MKTETAKGNGTKNEGAGFGCCNLENFEEMFEKMSWCFPRQDGPVDFSAIRDGMMKRMTEMCCPPKTADSKEDTELQKEKKGETESTE